MKKKKLATASLLLALLMPLGATPLAAYADEVDAQAETSTVEEATPETAETDEDTGSEVDTLEAKEEVSAPVELGDSENETSRALTTAPATLGKGEIWLNSTQHTYDNIVDAIKAAQDGEAIYLGSGHYKLYGASTDDFVMKDKNLTFVGQSTDKTFWDIGTPKNATTGEKNGDYSFDGANSVTFKDLTLVASVTPDGVQETRDYTGFIRANHTIVDSCVIDGRTSYWGYETATFTNTTFKAPGIDYAIWTYSSPEMTFDHCVFNTTLGKAVNVYTDYGAGQHDVTVNFISCTVNSRFPNKTALSINDSLMTKAGKGFKFYVNISGDNVIKGLSPDKVTCSRLFGFGNDKITHDDSGYEYHYDSGATVVKIEGETVWENGTRVGEHNREAFATGSYDNGNGKDNTNQYTDGYKDNQVYLVYGEWPDDWTPDANIPHLFHRTRTVTEKCRYCNYSNPLDPETETKQAYLLHYDLNGGTGAEGIDYSDRYYFEPEDGNTATVAADPSRAGYVFAGWQDADGNWYTAGDTVIVDHDITLTAQWNKLVTVHFDLCGHGGAGVPDQTFVSGGKASEPAAPKEDGWVFGGWYTERSCQYRFNFDGAVTSDITLYAKWDRVTTVVSAPVATPTPSPAPAAATTTTKTVKNVAIPQTSDAFPLEGLLALLAVGAVGFGAAGWLRKKHH